MIALQLTRLVNASVHPPGRAVLRNVETRWLSQLKPAERVWDEFVALVLVFHKLAEEKLGNAESMLDKMLDFKHLSLSLMLPMLRELQHLVKVCQKTDVFIHELTQVIVIKSLGSLFLAGVAWVWLT